MLVLIRGIAYEPLPCIAAATPTPRSFRTTALLLRPPDRVPHRDQAVIEPCRRDFARAERDGPGLIRVPEAEFQRVDAELLGELVDGAVSTRTRPAGPVAAELSARRERGVDETRVPCRAVRP